MRNASPMLHELKCWPGYFQAILDGEKTFEIRKNDREFRVGDTVRLKEYQPLRQEYTGREKTFVISYVETEFIGITEGFCVLGMRGKN